MRLISGLILVFLLIAAHTPNTQPGFASSSELQTQEVPVVYGKKDDGFPERVNVRGVIEQISVTGACGLARGAGVLQIKLARTSPGYNRERVYVAAPCLLGWEGEKQYLGATVCMNVKKMKEGDTCHADYITNFIDSKGVPFYCLSWQSWKIKEFLKQVACKTDE